MLDLLMFSGSDDDSGWAIFIAIIFLVAFVIAAPMMAIDYFKEKPKVQTENPMVYRLDDTRWQNGIKLVKRIPEVTVTRIVGNQVTVTDVNNPKNSQTISEQKFRDRYDPWVRLDELKGK